MISPVGVSVPVVSFTRKLTTVSLFWFAADNAVQDGSRPKKRGVRPRVDSQPTTFNMPVRRSTAKIAMLSWPRFDP